jgi:hypothetical protein
MRRMGGSGDWMMIEFFGKLNVQGVGGVAYFRRWFESDGGKSVWLPLEMSGPVKGWCLLFLGNFFVIGFLLGGILPFRIYWIWKVRPIVSFVMLQ